MHPQTWLVGADPSCDLVVNEPTVSGRHCRLSRTRNGYLLEDLRSRNGTFVNGKRIDKVMAVTTADHITLGKSVAMPWPHDAEGVFSGDMTVHVDSLPDKQLVLDRSTGIDNEPPIQLAPDHPYQRAQTPEYPLAQAQAWAVAGQSMVVGRDRSCDVVLADPLVSRRHARLTDLHRAITLEDLGSSNGTYVNGERITGSRSLRSGDLIAIGRYTFKLTPDGLEQRDFRGNLAIEARGVTVDVPGRRLLDNVSLTVYPSELVGLMGPSGAGKTTLMNALNGYTPPTAGWVLFNGRDLYANYEEFQGLLGYVPQDDIMHRDLTVAEALYYTARLRLPGDFSNDEIDRRMRTIIAELGLDGTENVVIGSPEKKGISGGQRKRVNLAMELLTEPAGLFLDEPTSGLSSEDALVVLQLLRKLADDGKTIIVTIHQPSLEVFRLFDNLIVVAKDARSPGPGRLTYYGPAYPQAVDFFNPAGVPRLRPGAEPSPDEVLRGLAKDETAAWVERYAASALKRQFVDDRAGKQPSDTLSSRTRPHRAAGLRQWWTLVRRCMAVKLRDRANSVILMAQAPIIALLVVFVFGKRAAEEATAANWQSVGHATSVTVFLLGLASLWFGCSNAAREIVGEWAIYHRERMVHLKIPSYVGSKFVVLGALCLLQCAILLGVVHWGAGLRGPWSSMFVLLTLTSLVGLGIGLNVSSLARSSEVAIALLPLILLPMVILGGILQPLDAMNAPVRLLAHAMPSRWAFEGLLLLEADHRPKLPQPTKSGGAKQQDLAEHYFPVDLRRTGTRTACVALTSMLLLLLWAVQKILRSRDVH